MSKKLFARPAALALIAANFIPLWGVVCRGWDAANIVQLYWAENVVFGLITFLRILTNRHPGTRGKIEVGKNVVAAAIVERDGAHQHPL